jgi:predicted acetylornithine/succinylornithine family transaminase
VKAEEIYQLQDQHGMRTYQRYPVALVRGQGMRVWDADGREYLDFLAGIAVCNLGHCHALVVHAVSEQVHRLMHVSNLYYIEPQARLAAVLAEKSFADRVFFCNSGAEANEAAIKLARRYGLKKRAGAHEIITMHQSFHGRTMATLSATGQERLQAGFQPLLGGFRYVPYDDVDAVAAAIDESTCAVMVEPIQGEGGVVVPADDYLPRLKDLCRERGILFILDEVQTGMGRTGRLFAHEHSGITPDIMTLAKGLGNGFPIGAMLATEEVASLFAPGSHASTFGGNPLACSAALATIAAVDSADVLENCRRMGDYLRRRLLDLQAETGDAIITVRGRGLMVGAKLKPPVVDVVRGCMERGVLVGPAGGNTLRLTPPLIVTAADIDRLFEVLAEVLGEVLG